MQNTLPIWVLLLYFMDLVYPNFLLFDLLAGCHYLLIDKCLINSVL